MTEKVPVFVAELLVKGLKLLLGLQLLVCTGLSVTYIVGTVVSWRMLVIAGTYIQMEDLMVHGFVVIKLMS